MKPQTKKTSETVEMTLSESALAALAVRANRAGTTINQAILEVLESAVNRPRLEPVQPIPDTVTVTLGFSETEWHRLEGKAKLAHCSTLGLLTSTCDLLADTEELVPCWIPQTIYNRLWQAASAADIDADRIAEAVLGDLVADPAALADLVRTGWQIAGKESTALNAVLAGWTAEEGA